MNLATITDWYCPACGQTDQTREAKPHTRFHVCPKMHGMTTPFVQKGIAAKLEARERDDYVGAEIVQTDDRGRPIMSIVTTRDNGTDTVVFAPTATGRSI